MLALYLVEFIRLHIRNFLDFFQSFLQCNNHFTLNKVLSKSVHLY